MNTLRRSSCALYQLLRGEVRRRGSVCHRGKERRGAGSTACLLQNRETRGLPHFTELHSQTHTNTGDRGGEENSPGRKTPTKDHHQQQGPVGFNLDVMVSLLRQENAEDICVIKVPEELKYTEFFIVVSGSSTRHLKAMALYAIKVYKFLKRDCDPHVHLEGKDAEDWMCIDFGSMVVHFMLPETRATYELEKLWTLRSFDEQLSKIPAQNLPADFVYDAETQ